MNALNRNPDAKLPSLREFAEFLFRDGDSSMHAAKRTLLVEYAKQRACLLGENAFSAMVDAQLLADECTLSADEMEAEYGR